DPQVFFCGSFFHGYQYKLMPVGAEQALSLFVMSSASSQPLESLQPLTARLPALVGSTWLLALFVLSSCKCLAPRVISQPSCVAKNATLLVCLMPVGAEQALSLF
ncbi:hypothetical protein A1A1_18935, partial [Planococcus antarcticus DSM 14505]